MANKGTAPRMTRRVGVKNFYKSPRHLRQRKMREETTREHCKASEMLRTILRIAIYIRRRNSSSKHSLPCFKYHNRCSYRSHQLRGSVQQHAEQIPGRNACPPTTKGRAQTDEGETSYGSCHEGNSALFSCYWLHRLDTKSSNKRDKSGRMDTRDTAESSG